MRLAVLLTVFSLSGAAAASQPPPPTGASPSEAATPQPVVVTARSPRLWKLVRGASTVWVLGEIEPMPRGLAWNSAPLAKVIRTADLVLLPPDGHGGLGDGLGALARSRLPGGARLDAALPPQLDARYKAALAGLGRNPDAPRRDKPGWAALFLEFDFVFRSRATDISEPSRTVERLARQSHVPVRRVASYKAGSALRELVALPPAEGEAALADAAEGVIFGLGHVGAAGRAWAIGDLQAVRANSRADETPLVVFLHTPTGKALGVRALADTTQALRSALDKPGVTVAVLRLTDIVQRGGVFDRLRQEGVQITEPPP